MVGLFPMWTEGSWRWWWRFRCVTSCVQTRGCQSNDCLDETFEEEGCPCNNYRECEKKLDGEGLQRVAMFNWGFLRADSHGNLIKEFHLWGR